MHSMVSEADVDSAARERDFAYLRDLIRDMRLSPEMREYLALAVFDLLTGKIKRPAHRPTNERTRQSHFQIAMQVLKLRRRRWPMEAAIKQTADDFRCGVRKVYYSLDRFKRFVAEEEFDDERFERHELGVFTDEEWRDVEERALDWLSERRDDPEPAEEEIEAAVDESLSDLARGK